MKKSEVLNVMSVREMSSDRDISTYIHITHVSNPFTRFKTSHLNVSIFSASVWYCFTPWQQIFISIWTNFFLVGLCSFSLAPSRSFSFSTNEAQALTTLFAFILCFSLGCTEDAKCCEVFVPNSLRQARIYEHYTYNKILLNFHMIRSLFLLVFAFRISLFLPTFLLSFCLSRKQELAYVVSRNRITVCTRDIQYNIIHGVQSVVRWESRCRP